MIFQNQIQTRMADQKDLDTRDTIIVQRLRELATDAFCYPEDWEDERPYLIRETHLQPLLDYLEELRRNFPQFSYLGRYHLNEPVKGNDDQLHFLFHWLLHNHQEYCKILTAYCREFILWSLKDIPLNRPLCETIFFGSLNDIKDYTSDDDILDHPLEQAVQWAYGNLDLLLVNYYESPPEYAELYRQYILRYLKEFPTEMNRVVELTYYYFCDSDRQEFIPRLHELIRQIHWWKFEFVNHREYEGDKLTIKYHDFFSPGPDGGKRMNILAIPFIDMQNKEVDREAVVRLRNLFILPAIPMFDRADIPYYPKTFIPMLRQALLIWKRCNMNKDIIRSILVHYILWNSFQEPDEIVERVHKKLKKSYRVPRAKLHTDLLKRGIVPINGNVYHIRRYEYALMKSNILEKKQSSNLRHYFEDNFIVYELKGETMIGFAEISKMSLEQVVARFHADDEISGDWVLLERTATGSQRDSCRYVINLVWDKYPLSEIIGWLRFRDDLENT